MKMNRLLLIGLAAMPMLIGCNKTVVGADVCDEANQILNENKNKIHSCHDAVVLLGQKLQKSFEFNNGSEFVYDSKAKQMVIMKGDEITYASNGYTRSKNTLDYFKFVSSYIPNSKYSQYLKKSAIESDTLWVTTGFDAGYHKDIKNIKYSNHSGKKRDVILRTYCDYLTIDAPDDSIVHYSDATNLIVNNVSNLTVCGSYAYIKARKGNLKFSGVENGLTDMLEVVSGCESYVTTKAIDDEANVYSLINWDSIEGLKQPAKNLITYEAKDAEELTKLASFEGSKAPDHIRITNDIKYTNADSLQFNRAVCIDLNGHKLTFDNSKLSTSSQVYEAMRIQSDVTTDKSMYIIDSQDYLDENSGINLINCSIIVSGVSGESDITSNLVINGGIITQTITANVAEKEEFDWSRIGAAVSCIGNTSSKTPRNAYVSTYGGRVVCKNETKVLNKAGCLGAVGVGANINVVYGSLISNDYCICGRKLGGYSLGDTNISISGGSLTSSDNTCLYFPVKTNIQIDGGTLNGMSCINANTGSININNSKLNATGQHFIYSDKNYDGSPIYIPKEVDSGDLNVVISGSVLSSKFAYIVDVIGEDTVTSSTTVDCKDGTYTYYLGDGVNKECPHATVTKGQGWIKREN